MTDETAQLRREMAGTRDRMARDIDELRDRARRRVDAGRLVREHPWSALGAAVALGAVIGGTGADEKVASAAASAVTGRTAKRRSHEDRDESQAPVVEEHRHRPGIGERLVGMLGATVAATLDRVIDEVRVASREWGARRSPSMQRVARRAPVAAAAVVGAVGHEGATDRAVDAVPVPNEMAPAELGLRAEAVEAVGGGTHEPPLEPGAGELGARWS
ncbi:MAG TPA: hypothetical protein VGH98_21545 [Gemmatimonadaceae bacterium]|jgi:hypothetical protein